MYYNDIVGYLKQIHPKDSADLLNKIFLSLLTEYSLCSLFIEAGAFEATASKFIKEKNKNCRVYAFEANIDNYNHFKDKLDDINYLYLAVSDKIGEITFKQQSHTSTGFVFSKIRGNNSIKSRVLDKNTIYNDIEVPCVTLDDFFKDKVKLSDSIGVWIDLEGAAFEALTKSTEILKKTTFLKIEVEDKQYWENQKLSDDIIELLSKNNLIPILRDFEGVTVAQYNIIFANRIMINDNLKKHIDKLIHETKNDFKVS